MSLTNFIRALAHKHCVISDFEFSIESQEDMDLLDGLKFGCILLNLNVVLPFFEGIAAKSVILKYFPSLGVDKKTIMSFNNAKRIAIDNFPGKELEITGDICKVYFGLKGVSSIPQSITSLAISLKFVERLELEYIGEKHLFLEKVHATKITIRSCFDLVEINLPKKVEVVTISSTKLLKFVCPPQIHRLTLVENDIREIEFGNVRTLEAIVLREKSLKRIEIQNQLVDIEIKSSSTILDLISINGHSSINMDIFADVKDIKVSCYNLFIESNFLKRVYAKCSSWKFKSMIPREFYHDLPPGESSGHSAYHTTHRKFWFVNSRVTHNRFGPWESKEGYNVVDFYPKEYFDIINTLPQPIAEAIRKQMPEFLSF